MTGILQASLTGGELSPGLWGRVDMARYQNCLELASNVIIQPYGGIKNRAGFEYLGTVKNENRVRLIQFIFSEDESLVLEFGAGYIRFWRDGEVQRYTGTVTPWNAGVSYQSYGIVHSYGGVNYINLVVPNLGHNPASTTGYWYPLTDLVIEIPTPYSVDELRDISFVQSGDVIFLAHQNHAPRVLRRWGNKQWQIGELDYINGPFSVLNTSTAALQVSAVTGTITITNTAGNGIFTSANIGQLVYVESKNYRRPWQPLEFVGPLIENGIRRSDGKYYQCVAQGTTGTQKPVHTRGVWSDGGVDWNYLNSGFGIARITAVAVGGVQATATVITRMPDDVVTNASDVWAFCDWKPGNYPGSVTIHQQRLVFGGSPNFPETIWMSRIGAYNDFGTSSPVIESDSLSITLAANTVNLIRGLLSLNNLMVLTSGGAWALGTGDADAITPTNVGAKMQSFRGSAKIDPLGVGRSAIYLQDKGQVIRDLAFESQSGSYQALDLTLLASHLFEGYQVLEWAWQEAPFQTLWVLRSDGVLLSACYVREQEILAWARHDVSGTVESLCVVPEGAEHVLYIQVLRVVNGASRRYVERMAGRSFTDIEDAFFVDSGKRFDNTNTTTITVTLTGGTNWDEGETLTLTGSSALFSFPAVTDVGDQIAFVLSDGSRLTFSVEALTSTTVATVRANRTVPAAYRSVALTGWNWARDRVDMSHLIGQTVSILADGCVQAPAVVGTDGYLVLDPPAVKASVGIGYNSDLKTLDPALNLPETPMDKRKNITQVRFMVRESRGMQAGRSFDALYAARSRNAEPYDAPPSLVTGISDIAIACTWEPRGSICLRQSDPLPINWVALIPELQVGGK